jgi:hypothetical protein
VESAGARHLLCVGVLLAQRSVVWWCVVAFPMDLSSRPAGHAGTQTPSVRDDSTAQHSAER